MVRFRQILGENASVITVTTDKQKRRLPTIVNRNNDDDVYNVDEIALLCKVIPNRSLLSKEDCKGGKRSKERYTTLLCSNWSGTDKLKLLVIGKTLHITSSDYNR